MVPHATASALGVRGVLFTLARADGSEAAGRVHVSLDYSAFADAYGGNYASRLRLVEFPACALTTPQLASCRRQIRPKSANDARTGQVGADVTLPGTAASLTTRRDESTAPVVLTSAENSPELVLAALASQSGSGGNYGAEPVSEGYDWVTGGSSGAFTYSYPIKVPGARWARARCEPGL
jgi:hypothetical protein